MKTAINVREYQIEVKNETSSVDSQPQLSVMNAKNDYEDGSFDSPVRQLQSRKPSGQIGDFVVKEVFVPQI